MVPKTYHMAKTDLNVLKITSELISIGIHSSVRVENSKTFQNQIAQCFFIGLYDIETGDDFYFFKKNFFDR